MRVISALTAFFSAVVLCVMSLQAFADELPTDPHPLIVQTITGPVVFHVELALTPEQRSTGLMHRQTMAGDHGMLFRFDKIKQVFMWMKDTPLPLDMVFMDDSGVVTGIAAHTVPFSETIISSPGLARYVLELNAGTAAQKGITAGDKVSHPAIAK